MTSTKSGCQGMLELEAEAKWGKRERGSSAKSSIIVKGMVHCFIMSSWENLGNGPWICDPRRSTRARTSIIPNIQDQGKEAPNGALIAQPNIDSSNLCEESPTLQPPIFDMYVDLMVFFINSRARAIQKSQGGRSPIEGVKRKPEVSLIWYRRWCVPLLAICCLKRIEQWRRKRWSCWGSLGGAVDARTVIYAWKSRSWRDIGV